jgi:hypothetical protein
VFVSENFPRSDFSLTTKGLSFPVAEATDCATRDKPAGVNCLARNNGADYTPSRYSIQGFFHQLIAVVLRCSSRAASRLLLSLCQAV